MEDGNCRELVGEFVGECVSDGWRVSAALKEDAEDALRSRVEDGNCRELVGEYVGECVSDGWRVSAALKEDAEDVL